LYPTEGSSTEEKERTVTEEASCAQMEATSSLSPKSIPGEESRRFGERATPPRRFKENARGVSWEGRGRCDKETLAVRADGVEEEVGVKEELKGVEDGACEKEGVGVRLP